MNLHQCLIFGLLCLLATPSLAKTPTETPIEFSTMDGQTTSAFEGYLEVPENRTNPDSRKIAIHYVRFPSTSDSPGSPIIYLAGGPGGSGIQTARYPNFRFPLFMALRQHGDVIALDQRGTGKSKTSKTCRSGHYIDLAKPASETEVYEKYRAAAKTCVKQWLEQGIDVTGYNTVENALDIDDLRSHIGADKVSLWGISYGSHLAFAALKAFPERIDKVIIASAEGLNQTVKLPARTDAYIERLQTAINTQPAAGSQYPDVGSLMKRVHDSLERKPLTITIPVEDAEPITFLFQKHHMQIIASSMIADPHRGVPTLLELYKTIDEGDHGLLTGVLSRGFFNDPELSFELMPLAMDVASGVTDSRLRLVERQSETSLLGLQLNFPMPMLNKSLVGLDLGDQFRQEVTTDVPTLLFTGTLDGRTYIEAQAEATTGFSNLTQIMVRNAGHNLFMRSPNVEATIHQFLSNEPITIRNIEVPLPNFAPD